MPPQSSRQLVEPTKNVRRHSLAKAGCAFFSIALFAGIGSAARSAESARYERVVEVWAINFCLHRKGYMTEINALEWAIAKLEEEGTDRKVTEKYMGRKGFVDQAEKVVRGAGGCNQLVEERYEPTTYGKVVGIYADIYCLWQTGYMSENQSIRWGHRKLESDYGISEGVIEVIQKRSEFGVDVSRLIDRGGGCEKIVRENHFDLKRSD